MSPEPPNYTLSMPLFRNEILKKTAAIAATSALIIVISVLRIRTNSPAVYPIAEHVLANESENLSVNFDQISKELSEIPGTYSLYIKDLDSGDKYTYNTDQAFYAASLYKFPIAMATLKEVEKGKLSLSSEIAIMPYDYTSGTGVLTFLSSGAKVPLQLLVDTLLRDSDNISQNVLLRTIPYETKKEAFNVSPQALFLDRNIATTTEIAGIFEAFYQSEYLNQDDKAYLLELLTRTSFDDRISPYLAPRLTFAHKIGSWQSSYHDCGLVFEGKSVKSVCLMSQNTNIDNFVKAGKITAKFVNQLTD